MSEKRKKYDREFREGAVRIVRETGKSIAAVARDLGIHGAGATLFTPWSFSAPVLRSNSGSTMA